MANGVDRTAAGLRAASLRRLRRKRPRAPRRSRDRAIHAPREASPAHVPSPATTPAAPTAPRGAVEPPRISRPATAQRTPKPYRQPYHRRAWHLERAAKIEERLGAAKRQLANRRKIAGKLGKRASSLSTAERGRLLSLQREIKELEGKVGKIGKLRQGAIKARRMAIHVVQDAGKKLGATAFGRVLSTAAGKALGLALKRFLPIYNWFQLAKDLYTVGSFLANADWSKLADGKAGAGSGGEDDSGAGAGQGEGKASAGGDGGDGSGSEEIATDDLEAPAPAELNAVAERIVGSLVKSGAGKGQTLDADAKDLINRVVPSDLSREELEVIAQRLQDRSATADSRPLTEAVIEAIQHVRPDGKPRAPTSASAASTPAAREPGAPTPSRPHIEPPRMSPPATAQRTPPRLPPGSRIIDVRGYLIANTTVDPVTGKLVPGHRGFDRLKSG
ncbi:MAG: hypothetical protein M3680_33710 [Myxococcota bacterium]|nr:hypothetical protein [Myxococcota bacterium]